MYSPSKHHFKHIISMDPTPKPPNMNLPSEKDHALTNNGEYSDWDGFASDAGSPNNALTNSSSSEEQERENPIFIHESSPMESSQSFVDALEYQPTEEPNDESNEEDPIDLDSASKSLSELPPRLSTHDQLRKWWDDEGRTFLNQKPGKKRNTKFVSPPNGELRHPYLDWQLDKASMDKYRPEYAKQEGFDVNSQKEHKGMVTRFHTVYIFVSNVTTMFGIKNSRSLTRSQALVHE